MEMEICSIGPDLEASSSHSKYGPSSEASSSHSKYGYGEPRPLNLGCRIFISHSGRDKDFVRHLHHHLVNKVYCDKTQVFFDEESLPTAEPISMENILAEARGCELGILVLSKDFFMHTQNPMLELEALTTSSVRLLPLFFRISVDEFKKMRCENEWEERWKEWLKGDEQRLGAWKHALKFVDRFSGLEKRKRGINELDYILNIVGQVALIAPPAVSFVSLSEKGVCGMDRICKEVNDMYIQCASKRTSHSQTQVVSASASTVWGDDSNSSLDLVGIYGFAGLGKSTLCRGLCDFYAADFHGRVFYLDLGSVPVSSQATSQTYSSKSAFMLRMQYLLSQLTGSNIHIQYTEFYQIQNVLRNWIRKDRIFLAIDNILPDSKTLDEVHFYLECEFARGSKVLITSRSGKLLEQVMSEYKKFSAVIEHIPTLRFEEARDIFVNEIPKLGQISDVEEEVKECVSMCAIYTRIKLHDEHEDGNKCYHPLMLKSSAASIRHSRRPNVNLKSKLRGFLQSATAVDKSALKAAFEMLDITYAILRENEKKVFLDLALFYKVIYSQSGWGRQIYTWIQTVHSHLDKNELDDILLHLEDLSFIVMKNVYPQSGLRLHDLVVDFSMYKIMQGADTMCSNPNFLLLDNGTKLKNSAFGFLLAKAGTRNEWPSESNALKSVRTINVSRYECRDSGAQVLEQLDLRNFEGAEVLHLVDNPGLHEVLLSCNTIAHLCSFIVRVHNDSDSLRCIIDECWPMPNRTMTGGQLVWVELKGNIILSTCRKRWWWQGLLSRPSRRYSLDGLGILQPFLCNLQYLVLCDFPAKSIDVTTCTNLIRMRLSEMPSLTDIRGLETLTNLKELYICRCPRIVDVTTCSNLEEMILEEMPSLRAMHAVETLTHLYIKHCCSLERISFPSLPIAGKLAIYGCPVLKNVGGLLLDRCFGDCHCYGVAIQDLVSVEIGSSKFKATVTALELSEKKRVQGLARLKDMHAKDVQHVGLFISALLKAEATCLDFLTLQCKKDGDCGCDEIGPHLGPGQLPLPSFRYHCPQVRSIASLPLLMNSLVMLDLRGCRNVEVWPDFATMTSLEELNLSHTSLKEWPTGVQLLRQLRVLDIQGCWQLPAEEMMNAITCSPLGCNSACGRGSLASLLADLKDCRRDRGSVADALDSQCPEIALLFHEQRQYFRYPCGTSCPLKHVGFHRHTELCYLIRVMYDLWFGVEGQAGSAHKDCCPSVDGVPRINEKLKRLLCSENFMSLPFYVWRIGRTRVHALDEWGRYPWREGYEIYMAFALLGSASIGCFNAPLNDDLKDRMVNFIQFCVEAQPQGAVNNDFDMLNVQLNITAIPNSAYVNPNYLDQDAHERLAMRVGDAICQMARAPSVAAALGQDFKFKHITVDGLKASYNTIEIPEEDVYENLIKWMRFTCRDVANGVVKISCVVAKLDKVSVHTMSLDDDDLGARVLHKIMPKILSISSLDFHGGIDGVNDGSSCCGKSKCHEMRRQKCEAKACCYLWCRLT